MCNPTPQPKQPAPKQSKPVRVKPCDFCGLSRKVNRDGLCRDCSWGFNRSRSAYT